MPRKPRLNMAGFHHIVNRGIERSNVYRSRNKRWHSRGQTL